MFLGILLASSGILIAVSVLLHRAGGEHRIEMVEHDEIHAVGMRQDAVAGIIEGSISDLLFLAELNELGPFVTSGGELNREALSRELLAFARRQEIYDQIRILSPAGMEMLRVDYEDDAASLVAANDLQSKGERDYFLEMSGCAGGSVYVSRFDLNVENGTIDHPLRPMLRLGLALGTEDAVAGYLLLNLKGSIVLDAFSQAHPDSEAIDLLTNADGYWLRGPVPGSEWGFALPERSDQRFSTLFPEEWEGVATEWTGQLMTANGLFTFDTLIPYVEADAVRCAATGAAPAEDPNARHWKNVSWVPTEVLAVTRNAGAAQLAGWNAVGVLILGSGAWILSRWLSRRAALLRRTASEKELLQSTLGKYMPQEICNRLLGDPGRHAQLGGEAQDVAVMFADIRGFTRFAERHAPKDVVAVLNRTLTELTAPLRMYGGILDKYIGDGFLAFFEPSMRRAFANLWADAPNETLRELGLGVGISTGRVIVGNVGSEDAMDFTVVGDAVNVASRLQSMAEAGDILVSQPAFELLDGEGSADCMRLTKLRGRREPMNVYKLNGV